MIKTLNSRKVALLFLSILLISPIKIKADTLKFYIDRGVDKVESGDFFGAQSDFNKAIDINPKHALSYFNRGTLKGRYFKDYYGAISDFTKSIELGYKSAYVNRGLAKKNLKDYEGAISDYTKAINIDPNRIKAYFNRGNIYYLTGKYYDSISDHIKALGIDPDNKYKNSSYRIIGLSKYKLGEVRDACLNWREATSFSDERSSQLIQKYCQ